MYGSRKPAYMVPKDPTLNRAKINADLSILDKSNSGTAILCLRSVQSATPDRSLTKSDGIQNS